jgi:hypothetical protein
MAGLSCILLHLRGAWSNYSLQYYYTPHIPAGSTAVPNPLSQQILQRIAQTRNDPSRQLKRIATAAVAIAALMCSYSSQRSTMAPGPVLDSGRLMTIATRRFAMRSTNGLQAALSKVTIYPQSFQLCWWDGISIFPLRPVFCSFFLHVFFFFAAVTLCDSSVLLFLVCEHIVNLFPPLRGPVLKHVLLSLDE